VARQMDDETVIAIFNVNREGRRLDLPLAHLVADQTVMPECWGHEIARVEHGMFRQLELAPRSARVFATETQ
jgi:hypothetical protein